MAAKAQDVASELGCSWHRVNASVRRWGGALIDADAAPISDVFALGLDETLMWRRGRFRTKAWSTSIVDVASGQLLDIGAFAKTMLLCLSSVDFGVLEEAVDLAGDVAFEAALGFSGGFAFGGSEVLLSKCPFSGV